MSSVHTLSLCLLTKTLLLNCTHSVCLFVCSVAVLCTICLTKCSILGTDRKSTMSVNEHCVNLGPKSGASLCNVVVEEPALVSALLLLWGADLCVCVCVCFCKGVQGAGEGQSPPATIPLLHFSLNLATSRLDSQQ